MARGGMYDQLAGGFARYSVDATWTVPHFEKMLYDNALLLRVYAHAWRATGGTAHAPRRRGDGRSGCSTSSGPPRAGSRRRWTRTARAARARSTSGPRRSCARCSGDDDGGWAADVLGVTPAGTFEHGTSVLQRRARARRTRTVSTTCGRGSARRATRRPRPARDDKVVSGWNGLAVAALAEAGALSRPPGAARGGRRGRRRWSSRRTCARDPDGSTRLVRASRGGVPGRAAGVLEDYANLAEGLLALSAVTGDAAVVRRSPAACSTPCSTTSPPLDGGFHDTADDETDAVVARIGRPQDAGRRTDARRDSPPPPGALLTYAALTGSLRHREAAERAAARWARPRDAVPACGGRCARACWRRSSTGRARWRSSGPRDDPRTAALRDVAHAVQRAGPGPRGRGARCRRWRSRAPARPSARRRRAGRVRLSRIRVRTADDPTGRAGAPARVTRVVGLPPHRHAWLTLPSDPGRSTPAIRAGASVQGTDALGTPQGDEVLEPVACRPHARPPRRGGTGGAGDLDPARRRRLVQPGTPGRRDARSLPANDRRLALTRGDCSFFVL